MQFTAPEFVLFFLVVYAGYLVSSHRFQNYLLLIASYFFYGWWDVRFLFLIAFSTTIDFWLGLIMEKGQLSRVQKIIPSLFILSSSVIFVSINFREAGSCQDCSRNFLDITYTGWTLFGTIAFLILASIAYLLLKQVDETARRRACLLLSLCIQLSLLGFFKYFNFFADSLHNALLGLGITAEPFYLSVILPIGISFYTFQSLSYIIDIYRKEIKPTHRFDDFALFVSYFPQLQAGPIERARHLIPELANPRSLSLDRTFRGIYLILLGFFKKVGIADGVAPVVDQVYNSTGTVTWIDIVVATFLFAIQIYCDFSGYTDIARGTSKMLGIELMANFNLPYFSKNPQDFWRRWHISLSTWLRDYLYLPLGGNRGSLSFICRNLMITMVLGGLWHGAAFNFVVWGIYQGTILCIYRVWRSVSRVRVAAIPVLRHSITISLFFVVTCYGWLLFRSNSMEQIVKFSSILVLDFGDIDYGADLPRLSALIGIPILAVLEFTEYLTDNPDYYHRLRIPVRGILGALMIFVVILGMNNEPAQFIYFQF